ncbi:uncharacterized protein LOC129237983 isoform X2 [Anastrepha obliqua]|uniref:uncharacterized protein LOC129237983 isoform X2 n=1 Tax=Anastrepha obliqua TaxID=95512 RepID=UPI0024099FC2|nr:uncharacterized protein LOC129237983 isoform X2 [Anastrepha obliqua]
MDRKHPGLSNFQEDQRANFLALILLDALEDGNDSDIKSILEKNNVDPSYVPVDRGISPLHYSCGMENAELALDITKRFLDDGADANVRSNENMTPIHVAAIFGRVDIVSLLLKYGADHDVMDDERKTPMHYAIEECHFEVLEVIRDHVFRHKYERRLEKQNEENTQKSVPQRELSPPPRIRSRPDEKSSDITPINKMLVNVVAKDGGNHDTSKNMYTPNRVHYNYDVTSPYYINITHRRHRPQPVFPAVESPLTSQTKLAITEDVPSEVQVRGSEAAHLNALPAPQKSVNVFELTEQNLKDLSLATSKLDRSCMSMVEAWRKKVECSRARKSILRQYTNVEEMLEEVMKNEHLNFTNTVLQEKEKTVSEDEPAKPLTESVGKFFSNSKPSLGYIMQKAAQAHVVDMDPPGPGPELDSSYHTVPPLTENNLNGNVRKTLPASDIQKSAKKDSEEKCTKNAANEYFLQMTEAYVHTDDENGLVFYETKLLSTQSQASNGDQQNLNCTASTNITIPLDYETDELRAELTHFGDPPGPITKSTKKLYIKRLIKYRRNAPDPLEIDAKRKNNTNGNANFSVELHRTIRSPEHFSAIPEYLTYESKSAEYFANLQNKHKMREGHLKQSFIYMLIDPRISCNLPGERVYLDEHKAWVRFLNSVFYVGKGKTSRPYSHLYEAMKLHSRVHSQQNFSEPNTKSVKSQRKKTSSFQKYTLCVDILQSNHNKSLENKKLRRILDIWGCGKGVVCLHVFHNILPCEAYTREAAIIDAFGLQHLTNYKRGDYYGPSQTWTMKEKKFLGISLLYKAMQIYLAEGESQLSPSDLI